MAKLPHLDRGPRRWRTNPQTRTRKTRAGGVTAKDALVHRTLAKSGDTGRHSRASPADLSNQLVKLAYRRQQWFDLAQAELFGRRAERIWLRLLTQQEPADGVRTMAEGVQVVATLECDNQPLLTSRFARRTQQRCVSARDGQPQ